MKRILVYLLSIAVLSITAAGCGGGGGGGGETVDALPASAMTTLERADSNKVSEVALGTVSLSNDSLPVTEITGNVINKILYERALDPRTTYFDDYVDIGSSTLNVYGYIGASESSVTGEMVMLFVDDYTYEENGTSYTIEADSRVFVDVVIYAGSGTALNCQELMELSGFTVRFTDSLGSGTMDVYGTAEFSGKVNVSSYTISGAMDIDLDANVVRDEIVSDVEMDGKATLNNDAMNVTYYVTVDGTTYGPLSD